jgi:hypothetical protein
MTQPLKREGPNVKIFPGLVLVISLAKWKKSGKK